MEEKKLFSGRVIIGVIFIAIGAFYLLTSFDIISYELRHIFISWPALLIVIGLFNVINSRKNTFGFILIIVGGIFMLRRIFPYWNIDNEVVIPAIMIGIGLFLLFRKKTPKTADPLHEARMNNNPFNNEKATVSKDRIDEIAIFGGCERVIESENFVGGSVVAIFGGCEIDLSECKLGPGDNELEVTAIFGGVELTIPEEWKVSIEIVPIFGGFSHKFRRDPNLVLDPSRVLHIRGTVVFGGGELKIRKR